MHCWALDSSLSPLPKGVTGIDLRKHLWPKKLWPSESLSLFGCSLQAGPAILFWVKETFCHPKWPQADKFGLGESIARISNRFSSPPSTPWPFLKRMEIRGRSRQRKGKNPRRGCGLPPAVFGSAPDPAARAWPWRQELAKKQGFPGRTEGGGSEAKRG